MKIKNLFLSVILAFLSLTFLFSSCLFGEENQQKSFKKFVKKFEPIDLPIDTNFFYRVHNSPLVTERIDTSFIRKFINPDYELKADMLAHDGFAYGFRLPNEGFDYESLIFYQSEHREQFFVLQNFSLEGDFIASLRFSGDSSSVSRLTGEISENRTIRLRQFLLHQPDSASKEFFYEIAPTGEILLLESFIDK